MPSATSAWAPWRSTCCSAAARSPPRAATTAPLCAPQVRRPARGLAAAVQQRSGLMRVLWLGGTLWHGYEWRAGRGGVCPCASLLAGLRAVGRRWLPPPAIHGPWLAAVSAEGHSQPDLQMRFVPGCALDPDGVRSYIVFGELKKQGRAWPGGITLQLLGIRAKSKGSVGRWHAHCFGRDTAPAQPPSNNTTRLQGPQAAWRARNHSQAARLAPPALLRRPQGRRPLHQPRHRHQLPLRPRRPGHAGGGRAHRAEHRLAGAP
jgi:hypothetical protein